VWNIVKVMWNINIINEEYYWKYYYSRSQANEILLDWLWDWKYYYSEWGMRQWITIEANIIIIINRQYY